MCTAAFNYSANIRKFETFLNVFLAEPSGSSDETPFLRKMIDCFVCKGCKGENEGNLNYIFFVNLHILIFVLAFKKIHSLVVFWYKHRKESYLFSFHIFNNRGKLEFKINN